MVGPIRRAVAGILVLAALAGCGANPVLDPYKPDPTPLPVATPSDKPVTYFPDNRAYYQYLPTPAIAKAVTLKILSRAVMDDGAWQMPVFMEIDRLTDADVVAELRRTAGRGVPTYVILDDAPEALAQMQPTIDALSGAGVHVILPHQTGGGGMKYDRQRARTLIAVQEDGAPVMMVYTAPLTPEGLAGQGPAIVDLDEKDIMAQIGAISALFSGQALQQHEPQVVAGPGFVRNNLASLLAGAKTGVKLQGDAVSDPAMITALGALVAKGLPVRVTLAAGRTADRDALVAAGVTNVRVASEAHLASLAVVDGKKVLLGSSVLTTPSLDQDREVNLLLEQPDIWPGATRLLDAGWEAAK